MELSSTGQLTGGNPGSKIDYCGSTVWNGPGPTYGPTYYGNAPLPVELLYFTAVVNDNGVVDLKWATATEQNNHFFTLERSTNGISYTSVARIDGRGNSTQHVYYEHTDRPQGTGTFYYRLSQTDYDGQREVFPLVAVEIEQTNTGCVLSVYPNPCVPQCKVVMDGCPENADGTIQLDVLDASGSLVQSTTKTTDSNGGFTYSIDGSSALKPGVYIIRGVSAKSVYQSKAVIK